jgi:hypothetical protein
MYNFTLSNYFIYKSCYEHIVYQCFIINVWVLQQLFFLALLQDVHQRYNQDVFESNFCMFNLLQWLLLWLSYMHLNIRSS